VDEETRARRRRIRWPWLGLSILGAFIGAVIVFAFFGMEAETPDETGVVIVHGIVATLQAIVLRRHTKMPAWWWPAAAVIASVPGIYLLRSHQGFAPLLLADVLPIAAQTLVLARFVARAHIWFLTHLAFHLVSAALPVSNSSESLTWALPLLALAAAWAILEASVIAALLVPARRVPAE
jgi:hypothetical protein